MPVTPFHFGLGALHGGFASRWFSFRIFCFANCLIDIEAIDRIAMGQYPYHAHLHSLLLASLVPTLLAIPLGIPLVRLGLFCLRAKRIR